MAVLYATQGGMGDVGKFAVALAREQQHGYRCRVRVIALSVGEGDGGTTDPGKYSVDVEDEDSRAHMEDFLTGIRDEIVEIDVASESAEQQISASLGGVDAVISCLGNRQPKMERWCALGTTKVLDAMKSTNVDRLVCLSSMGIGTDDFLKTTVLTCLWAFLLRTFLRSVRTDLTAMEEAVAASGLDYLLVRGVGLTPSERPRGSCDALLSREDHGVGFMLAKSDAAGFLLREALAPTLHGRAVTIGYSEPRSATDTDTEPKPK